MDAAIGAWTELMYGEHGAVHHVDVHAAGAVYRVFLLEDTLQVDISFWPPGTLRPYGARFRPLFGSIVEAEAVTPPEPEYLVGMAWLYLLHARSSIARDRPLQARHFLDGARDQILTLACVIHDLPERDARGVDDLPPTLKEEAIRLLPNSADREESERSLRAAIAILHTLTAEAAPPLVARLAPALRELGG